MVTPKPLRILIADDSELLRRTFSDQMNALSYAEVVSEVGTAQDAIQATDQMEPDVVVLDIEMPGSGIQALKRIRAQHATLPIIMLTNHADPFYKEICLREGADYFLDKSIEFERVPDVLADILDKA